MAEGTFPCKDTKMLRMITPRKTLLAGMLFGASLGCSDTDTTMTDRDSSADPGVTVTANKPVVLDPAPSTTRADSDYQNADDSESRTNTGVNVRDRDDATKTPFDQNENAADIQITAEIRSRIVDTEMSVNAQNVKIITQNGKVTLRGPVQSTDEKTRVEKIATEVAGENNVDSQLEVDSN
jgi:hyperosmotically inducible protein